MALQKTSINLRSVDSHHIGEIMGRHGIPSPTEAIRYAIQFCVLVERMESAIPHDERPDSKDKRFIRTVRAVREALEAN